MNLPNLPLTLTFYVAWLFAISHTLPELLNTLSTNLAISTRSTGTTTMKDEILFQQVPLDTNEQTACSPAEPEINWRGIKIRAPSRIVLPEKKSENSTLIIPVCGLYVIDVVNKFQHPGPKIIIVIDEKTSAVYKAALVKRLLEPTITPPPSPPIKPSKNAAFGSYFNVNAAAYVTLPLNAARYRVRVDYAGYQSNDVFVEVVER